MKNVLFVIPTLRMGGAEKSLVSLLKALDPNRVSVDLFLFEAGGVLQPEIPEWVNIIEADPITRGMTLELRYYLGGVLKTGNLLAAASRVSISVLSKLSRKPVFSWGVIEKHIPPLEKHYDVAIGYLEGFTDYYVMDKVTADKKIGWIHSELSGTKMTEQERDYYARFDRLVTISDVCRGAFIKMVPTVAGKIDILENIVLAEDVRKKAEEPCEDCWNSSNVTHLVSVGRLDHHKGMDVAARTAKILRDRNCSFCWHVYGQGVMQSEIEQYIAENSLQGIFVLEGLRKNPYPYMKQADIIVQPSRLEGKSLVLDEAKILGKAIVVTNYPSVKDQIADGVTGLITRMEPEAIADGIERLMKDHALKQRLEENTLREPNRSIETVQMFYEMINT